MGWIEDRLRSAALFNLAAILPFLALLAMGLLGLAGMLLASLALGPVLGALPALAGFFLLTNCVYGFHLAFKSFPGPHGRPLRPGEAPVLEERLAAARAEWKGPRAPKVILAPDAWSVELTGVPALGLFGWSRYHWYVGIYPLLGLSVREFAALAAWEVVFWSDLQGWLNLQVKRLASYWYRVHLQLEAMSRDRQGPFGWYGWYAAFSRPYAAFVVRAFQPFLAREFLRADRAVADKHGTPTLVRALCRLAILEPLVTRRVFPRWEAFLEGRGPLPEDLYQDLADSLGTCPETAEGMLALALDGLQREAPPLLRLRLDYLGAQAQVPVPPDHPAFRQLLAGTEVIQEIHGHWQGRIQDLVQAVQRQSQLDRQRFRQLSARMPGSFPDHPDSAEFLQLAFQHASGTEFDILLGAFRQAHPGRADGAFLAIRRALQRGKDFTAVLEAKELLGRDPRLAPACHEMIAQHLQGRGDQKNADKEWDRALRAAALVAKAQQERASAALTDDLEAHGCDLRTLDPIRRRLLQEARVQEAHLLRKKVQLQPERPVLLLVVRWRGPLWDPLGRKRLAFQRELQRDCPFPEDATGFVQVAGRTAFWRFGARLRALESLIFARG